MGFSDYTNKDFIEILASKEAVPGGGGAAALCGAIGSALGNMVCSLTAGKKKYAEVEDEITDIRNKFHLIQNDLLNLIDADGEAFRPLAAAYSLPAGTEEEKSIKNITLEECSKAACQVPLDIMKKCCEAIELVKRVAEIGSRLAISDAGCGAAVLRGALMAASLNIFINTKSLTDREFADYVNAEADHMIEVYAKMAEDIFTEVNASLR